MKVNSIIFLILSIFISTNTSSEEIVTQNISEEEMHQLIKEGRFDELNKRLANKNSEKPSAQEIETGIAKNTEVAVPLVQQKDETEQTERGTIKKETTELNTSGLYKWVDGDGETQFSDKKPAVNDVEEITGLPKTPKFLEAFG